jgi:hypothetical protein
MVRGMARGSRMRDARPAFVHRIAGFGAVVLIVGAEGGCSSIPPAAQPAQIAATLAGAGARAQASAATKRPGGVQKPLRVGPFVFYADVPLEANDPLFRELETLPDRIQRELRLPAGNAIVQVYLFDSQDRYEAYMRERFPALPSRRAYFVTDGRRANSAEDLQVYTWMGEHLRLDLRHELTHAVLHSVLAGVPLWLDEGLAGYFEQPPELDGLNADHLDKLRRGGATPDLPRLEGIEQVQMMEKPEYREAWAWVHFCLRGDDRARSALHAYLQELRTNPTPGPLSPRLRAKVADPRASLAEYLARLASLPAPPPVTAAAEPAADRP